MRIKNRFIAFCFLLMCCLLISRLGHAFDFWVNKSTNPQAGSLLTYLPNSKPGDMLGSVIIGIPSASTGTLILYDSSATANNIIGTVDISTGNTGSAGYPPREFIYNVRLSSGLTFSLTGIGSPNITILWETYR